MKKLSLLFVLSLSLLLAACGGGADESKSDSKTLKIGASNVPHAEILEKAKPILKEKGINLEISTFTDYVLPNKALEEKSIDANYFQHIPYLESQNKDNDYNFVNAGGVHIEPIGVYSKKYKSLDDLPKGATVIMSSSVADHGRMLSMLETEGLLKLKDGIDKTKATVDDIAENPKKLKFKTDVEATMLTQVYNNEEGDAVLINSNYAIDAGLTPSKDAIALESSKDNPYVNVIAVRKGDESKKEIKTLIEVLHSKEIQDFINKEYKGSVIPANE